METGAIFPHTLEKGYELEDTQNFNLRRWFMISTNKFLGIFLKFFADNPLKFIGRVHCLVIFFNFRQIYWTLCSTKAHECRDCSGVQVNILFLLGIESIHCGIGSESRSIIHSALNADSKKYYHIFCKIHTPGKKTPGQSRKTKKVSIPLKWNTQNTKLLLNLFILIQTSHSILWFRPAQDK